MYTYLQKKIEMLDTYFEDTKHFQRKNNCISAIIIQIIFIKTLSLLF